jgi:hypothetical protein
MNDCTRGLYQSKAGKLGTTDMKSEKKTALQMQRAQFRGAITHNNSRFFCFARKWLERLDPDDSAGLSRLDRGAVQSKVTVGRDARSPAASASLRPWQRPSS